MKLKIKGKLLSAFTIIIALTFILSVITILKLNQLGNSQDEIMDDQYPSVTTIYDMNSELINLRRIVYESMGSFIQSEKKEHEEEYKQILSRLQEDMRIYNTYVSSDEEGNLFSIFKTKSESYLKGSEEAMEAIKNGDIERATIILNNNEQEFDEAVNAAEKLLDLNKNYIEESDESFGKYMYESIVQIIVLLCMVIITGIISAYVISRNIIKSVNKILIGINKVSNGDLTEKIAIDTNDEMNIIGDSTNNLVHSLTEMIGNIKNVSEKVVESSDELSEMSEEVNSSNEEVVHTVNSLASGATKQSEAVQTSNEIIKTMIDDINEVAQNVESVNQSSESVLRATNNGLEQVNKAIEKINIIKISNDEVVKIVDVLQGKSTEIGTIVSVIKNLSSQTNLLALNAAIEAARAGEQGKGFAVVAEEVRVLAEESAKSADEISNLIENMQRQTERVVDALTNGTEQIEAGVEAVAISGQTFEVISNEIRTVVAEVNKVDNLTERVIGESDKVIKSIDGISEITEEAAASAEEVSALTEEQNAAMETVVKSAQVLAELGEKLYESVSAFKINEVEK